MRIYLAGAESMLNILAENNAKHVLATYYYLRDKSERTVERLLNTFPDVFLDSGGFSLNVSLVKEGMTWDEAQQDPRIANYLEEYARFVDKWGHRFTAVAELDVGPWEQKVRQREFLQQYTDRVIPVIHPTDPPEYQLYLMKNYEYVALGGVGDARSLTEIKAYVTRQLHRARRYNTLLHGFAITVVEIMRMLPFFSADSTSWLMGSKYGMTFWFDGRTLRSYDKFGKNVRRKFKREVMDLGLDWDKFINEHAKTVNRWNLLQWLQYQEYLNDTSGRGLGHFKAMQEHYFRKVEERNKKYQNLKGYNEWEIYGIK